MKARLPVVGDARPARAPQRAVGLEATPIEKLLVDRAMLGVCDRDAPELALRFCAQLIATLHGRGRRSAALLAATEGRTREADAQRLREAGAEYVIVLSEGDLSSQVQTALAALPRELIVVAHGTAFTAQLSMLLAVRVSLSPAVSSRSSCEAADIDLEIGPGMEGSATLIGDWLAACIPDVSKRVLTPRA